MRDRLKAIREAAAPLAESTAEKPKHTPGFVAALRAAREPVPEIAAEHLPSPDRIAVVSITRHGILMAGKILRALPGAQLHVPEKFAVLAEETAPTTVRTYTGKTGDQLGRLFGEVDALIAVFSLGALVRLIAPHLKSKETDPAVIVLDEHGQFVIPMLSGHLGGANALAGHLAARLGATAVLTTASDVRETLAVDLLGRELGWALEASHEALVHASAAVVNDEPVALVQEAGSLDWWPRHANGRTGPLPANLHRFDRLEEVDPARFAAVLWISQRTLPDTFAAALASRCVIYRPAEHA